MTVGTQLLCIFQHIQIIQHWYITYFGNERVEHRCGKCNGTSSVSLRSNTKLPEVLVFHLARFDVYGNKLKHSIEIPKYLNLNAAYDLVSVVNHMGEELTTGHYTADSYNFRSEQWMHFDDSII